MAEESPPTRRLISERATPAMEFPKREGNRSETTRPSCPGKVDFPGTRTSGEDEVANLQSKKVGPNHKSGRVSAKKESLTCRRLEGCGETASPGWCKSIDAQSNVKTHYRQHMLPLSATEGGLFLPSHFFKMRLLEEIRKAEIEADSILASAEKKRQDILDDAKFGIDKFMAAKEREIESYREKLVSQGMEKISASKEAISSDNLQKLKDIEKSAAKKKQAAVDLVLAAIEGEFK